ncbi:MAG: M48 family metallopeptidase [Nitrospira sp.]|nr:M48 family metallopeptidase [Nitrospira sp.]MCB9711079.1 M48 family metallopeptidase [Nitrospiraceae bacterium]MDR4488360.1 M48 family metallopeptidase [Nitrospirales bacterium]MCA9467476.1 M48 family metallopeptidase [Nitrospira sp.]MCA9474913.1 M48 family metallopeptidase [Nitrospira sp.]
MHKPVFLYTVYPVGRLVGWMMCILLMMGSFGCQKAPGTARDQLIYISEEKEIALGLSAFREVLKSARLSRDPEVTLMVNRIGQRIAKAANKPEYVWEFAVIQDDEQINAFALPGGKVAVFTGILKYTKTEAGLATVMAHEVAHALQRHGAERYSRGILEQIGQIGALAGAAAGGVDPGLAIGAMSAYGVGVSLPNSREQETEADYIGLQLMAKAGYDPREAVPFWERMSGCPRKLIGKYCFRSQSSIPEFLSTHPSDVSRINQIEAWLPQALKWYHPESSHSGTSPSMTSSLSTFSS